MLSSPVVPRKSVPPSFSRYTAALVCSAAVFLPCFVTLLSVFPVADDAWLLLLIKERGTAALASGVANRPLFAWILRESFQAPQMYLAIGLTVNTITWISMGLETQWLTGALFPEWRSYGPLAAVLAVAPIFSTIQLTTLPVTIPVNMGTVLCLGAVILAAHSSSASAWRGVLWSLAGALVCCAHLLSEYAWAGTATAVIVLMYLSKAARKIEVRRTLFRAVLALIGGAVIGAAIFKATSASRSGYTTNDVFTVMLHSGKELPFLVVDGYWRLLVGAFARAAGRIRFTSTEGSYVASAAYGTLMAGLLVWACRRKGGESNDCTVSSYAVRGVLLLLLMGAGLLPVVFRSDSLFFAGRDQHLEEFSTRLYLTAVPVAAMTFVVLVGTLGYARSSWAVVALVGFVIGDATFLQEWSIYRNSQKAFRLGPGLERFVRDTSGLTVIVLSDYLGRDYELTYKASRDWPAAESERVWFLWEGLLENRFGHVVNRETACAEGSPLHIEVTGVHRDGIVGRMVYVDVNDNRETVIEPYCLAAASP